MLQYMPLCRSPTVRSCWRMESQRYGASYNNPKQSIREDSARCARTTPRGSRLFSAAYTIDDGASLIPLADPLFVPTPPAHAGASLEDARRLPNTLNTFRAGSRAPRLTSIRRPCILSGQPLVCQRRRPGRIVIGGGLPPGLAAITSAGPNNAAGYGIGGISTPSRRCPMNRGKAQLDFASGFSGFRTTKTRLRAARA